jgi:hypothetical protein
MPVFAFFFDSEFEMTFFLMRSSTMVLRFYEHVQCPGINDHSLTCLRDSDGAENGALINDCSLACLHDGSNGGTSDLALAKLAGPLACSCVGSGGSADNGACFFWPSTAPQH